MFQVLFTKILYVSFLLMLGFLFYGCGSFYHTPVTNKTNISGVDFSKPMKRGEDCIDSIKVYGGSTIRVGNKDIARAARNGGIRKIYYVGSKRDDTKDCIVVFGE